MYRRESQASAHSWINIHKFNVCVVTFIYTNVCNFYQYLKFENFITTHLHTEIVFLCHALETTGET